MATSSTTLQQDQSFNIGRPPGERACRGSSSTRLRVASRCWRAAGSASAALRSPAEYAAESSTYLEGKGTSS